MSERRSMNKEVIRHGSKKDCVICFKEFIVKANGVKTCSDECSKENRRIVALKNKRISYYKKRNKEVPTPVLEPRCHWCNKKIEILPTGKPPPKCCRDNWKCKANYRDYGKSIEELKNIRPILYAAHHRLEIKCKAFYRCKNYYIPNKANHQYCTPDCNLIERGRKYIHQKYCAICNTEISRKNTYCSDKCLKESRKVAKVYREITCKGCNTNTFRSADPRAMYCTDYCRAKASYEKHKKLKGPYEKECIICKTQFVTNKPNQTICLAYDCKTARYNLKYVRHKTSKRNNYKDKDGYLYCVYHKELNIYKVGITYNPSDRVRKLEHCGFTLKLLYNFPSKHDARLAEREFYIDAESMAISPRKNDKEHNRFYDPIFKGYGGKTEIIYGEMIKYYELKKMLDSLVGEPVSL
tara:strand:- start:1142 stop:2371 length:1230 start_codon:yes stop_codon:yes gene_type:complete